MSSECILEAPQWEALDLEALATRAADAALTHLGYQADQHSFCILATNDAHIATLNESFRGKAAATNVLSWPSAERGADEIGARPDPLTPQDDELGDLALAYETCAKEARDSNKPLSEHLTHLIVHGLLHLLGYDHIEDEDAELMEKTEAEILCKLGQANPYIIE